MRAAKGHCDPFGQAANFVQRSVGVMRAAEGHKFSQPIFVGRGGNELTGCFDCGTLFSCNLQQYAWQRKAKSPSTSSIATAMPTPACAAPTSRA